MQKDVQNLALTKNKREKFRVEFRKQELDLLLSKKRGLAGFAGSNNIFVEPEGGDINDKINRCAIGLSDALEAGDRQGIMKNLQILRSFTCTKQDPPLDSILSTGLLPHLLPLLNNRLKSYCDIHLELLWLLTNLSCGPSSICLYLIDQNLIFSLRDIIAYSEDLKLIEQAIMCAANLSSEGPISALFFENDFEIAVQQVLTRKEELSKGLYRNIAFFLSNLARKAGSNAPRLLGFLSFLAQFLHVEDEETMIESTWAIYSLAEQDYSVLTRVFSLGVLSKVIKNLLLPNDKLKWASLKLVSLIARGPDKDSEVLYANNIFIYLSGVLDSKYTAIRKETLFCLSNLMAEDNEPALQGFLDSDLLHKVLKITASDEYRVALEGGYVLANFAATGTPGLVRRFVGKGGLAGLLGLIDKYFDLRDAFLPVGLGAVERVMGMDGKEREFLKEFVEAKGVEVVEKGRKEMWESVAEKCAEIYEKYVK